MSKKKQDFIDKELNKASKTLLRKSKKQPAALILVLLIALVLYVKNDTDLFSGLGTGTGGTAAEDFQAEGGGRGRAYEHHRRRYHLGAAEWGKGEDPSPGDQHAGIRPQR